MTSTHIDEISEIVRRAEAAAYELGKADAKREMLQHLTSTDTESKVLASSRGQSDSLSSISSDGDSVKPAHERQRAPKGIVPKFVTRVLTDDPGLTPKQIMTRAGTDFEKMIKPASVRSELRSGAESGKYKSDNGTWSMADKGFDEAGDSSQQDNSPASNSSHERTEDASSVTVSDLM